MTLNFLMCLLFATLSFHSSHADELGLGFKNCLKSTDNEQQAPCTCPLHYYDTLFGKFLFPETVASKEGTEIRAPCPFGMVDMRLEPITSTAIKGDILQIKEEDSGAKPKCKLISDNTEDMIRATWVLEKEPMHCRDTNVDREMRSMMKKIHNLEITPYNLRQQEQQFNMLYYWAVHPPGDYEAAYTLIYALGNLLSTYSFEEDPSSAEYCFKKIEQFAQAVPVIPGYRITVDSPHITVQTAQFPYNSNSTNVINYTAQVDNVELRFPSEVLKMGVNQNITNPKLRVMAYSEELFIHYRGQIETTTTRPTTTMAKITMSASSSTSTSTTTTEKPVEDNSTGLVGHWRIFEIDVLEAVISDLNTEFEYVFRPDNNESEIDSVRWRCVYWNKTAHAWSSDGVTTTVKGDEVICKANHFTAFSVLIDPLPLPIPGSDYAPIQNSVHSNILSILSSIGSAISIVGLCGVIVTYAMFRCLRRERSNRILLNLSVSLLLMHLISISSDKTLWDGHCLVPSMLLQYFVHTSLFWMLMEAHHMYQLLISVFVQPETRFMTKRCAIAWGIPLIIVGTCAAIKPEVYYTGRHDLCVIAAHLNLPLYYIAYMAPIIIILVVNLCVFIRIFNVLYRQTVKQKKEGRRQKQTSTDLSRQVVENLRKSKYVMLSPTQIKGAVTVMVLVGAGWIVGLLAVGPFEVFFKYLFCITNAGQGAFIFLFRVVLHPQACREWRKAVLGLKIDASEASTTSSTNINTTHPKTKGFVSTSPGFISGANSVENSLTPSNPDAKTLARTLANMLEKSNGQNIPDYNYRF